MSKIPFNDKMSPIILNCDAREEPPKSLLLRPYWLLRVLRKVIIQGGYLSPKVFVPKLVWSQYGVKFTGLSAKTFAFEQLLIAIRGRELLAESVSDHEDLAHVVIELRSLSKDLMQLQNNLSKPLTYIQEATIVKDSAPSPAKTSNVCHYHHTTLDLSLPSLCLSLSSFCHCRSEGCRVWSQALVRMSSNMQRLVCIDSARRFQQEWMMRTSFPSLVSLLNSARNVKSVLCFPPPSFASSRLSRFLIDGPWRRNQNWNR
jgi:hypothetical protein